MKLRMFALLMICAAVVAAADKPAGKAKKPAAPKAEEMTIPAGAVEVEPYTYSYTDSNGKKWIYRKTPFGVARMEDKGVSAEEAKKTQDDRARLLEATKAVEDGDSIRFERSSPFGTSHWQRKKTELNDVERAVWDRELQKRAANENAANASKD
jgi:hypothetical protein